MGLCGVCIPSSNLHHPPFPFVQNLSSISSSRKLIPIPPLPPSLSCSAITSSSCIATGRRVINLSFVGILLSRFLLLSNAVAEPALELDRYTDAKEGFSLLVPSSWIKVDKAGATVLFEDASKKANNVGVVVAPTRISSLGEFGTPQFVVDKLIQAEKRKEARNHVIRIVEKLIQAEKRKESTKEAEVISVSERSGSAGLQVYEFEYKVDSTRGGPKRVFSAAFVSSKRLYLLNITHSDSEENPLDLKRRNILEQVLHSFDAVPSS